MSDYVPKPIDTSKVVLPAEIENLTEKLAENAHDTWAKLRMKEGWTYGESRNDELKTHPCLVPYSDLPDQEKEYDRRTAIDTLRVIYAMGYHVEKGNAAE